jgi:hypothetical protein
MYLFPEAHPGHGYGVSRLFLFRVSYLTNSCSVASLDPDGNEIPMGEDDGLDPHLRARFYAQQARTMQQTADRYAAALGLSLNDEQAGPSADWSAQGLAPPVPAPTALVESKPYYKCFEATPLPMPLEDMVSSQKSYREDDVVFYVPRHASFVGR